jgi:hypothetical protein
MDVLLRRCAESLKPAELRRRAARAIFALGPQSQAAPMG